jgi:hypothetical protein
MGRHVSAARRAGIAVLNESTLIGDSEVALFAEACSMQLSRDVAPAWGLPPVPVEFFSDERAVPGGWDTVSLFDTPDHAQDLGFHSVTMDGRPLLGIYVAPYLDHGLRLSAISVVLSHQTIESFADPAFEYWASQDRDTLVARELCDPVEDDAWAYTIATSKGNVLVSDFVLPSWFGQSSSDRPFDYCDHVPAPFAMLSGGCIVTKRSGRLRMMFDPGYAPWKRQLEEWSGRVRGRMDF